MLSEWNIRLAGGRRSTEASAEASAGSPHGAGSSGDLPAAIATAARAYVGVPYRHLGRDRRGLDCVGLVLAAHQDCGLLAGVDHLGYGRRPRGHTLQALVGLYGRRVPVAEACVADVLVFAGSERLPCHLALVSESQPRIQIVHAWAEFRRVAEHALEGFSGGAPVAAYRHPELEEPAASRRSPASACGRTGAPAGRSA